MNRASILIWALVGCGNAEVTNMQNVSTSEDVAMRQTDTTFELETDYGASVQFDYFASPEPSSKLIVALPGWNHSPKQYLEHSSLLDSSRFLGYNVLLIHMGKSVYADSVYPETRKDYRLYPTATWFSNSVWSALEQHINLTPDCFVGVMGYSTGGRGAATIAIMNPERVSVLAVWSGDFKPELEPHDALQTNIRGPYASFKDRWDRADLCVKIDRLTCPVYISHGLKDEVVPLAQSKTFYNTLLPRRTSENLIGNWVPNAAHDWDFWSVEVLKSLDFFEKVYLQKVAFESKP